MEPILKRRIHAQPTPTTTPTRLYVTLLITAPAHPLLLVPPAVDSPILQTPRVRLTSTACC